MNTERLFFMSSLPSKPAIEVEVHESGWNERRVVVRVASPDGTMRAPRMPSTISEDRLLILTEVLAKRLVGEIGEIWRDTSGT